MEAQTDRLDCTLSHLSNIHALNLDMAALGDMNLCFSKWSDHAGNLAALVEKVNMVQVTCSLDQLVNCPTRSQLVGSEVKTSIIDHVYTNCSHKFTNPKVIPFGDSDHLGVLVAKITTLETSRPQTLRLRDYKKADTESMLQDIASQGINDLVLAIPDLDTAAEVFAHDIWFYLSKYAPIRVVPIK